MIFEILKAGLFALGVGFLIGAWIAISALIADIFNMDIDTLIFMQLLLGIFTGFVGRDVFMVVVAVFCLILIGVLGVYIAMFIANYVYEKTRKRD